MNQPTQPELEAVRRAWPSVAEGETVGAFLLKRGGRAVLVREEGEDAVILCSHPFDLDLAIFASVDRRRHDEQVSKQVAVWPLLALALRIGEERRAERAANPPDPSAPEPRLF